MEDIKKKCSLKKHSENEAINYCIECKINLCNKCEKLHSELFEYHNLCKIDSNFPEIFTGLCKEQKHSEKLVFFCITHNQLCCSSCIANIKDEIYGKHAKCKICLIEKIKEEKKNQLKENLKCLEELSKTFDESLNKLKQIIEKINESKENLKINIQKIFTKLRNTINDREDKLLLEIDNKYNDFYFKGDIIKQSEKLPYKIKESIEKGKQLDKKWLNENSKLNALINDCLNIENNIKAINYINKNIEKYNLNNLKIQFSPDSEEEINKLIEEIKYFGKISYNGNYKFKKCPIDISEERKYLVSGNYDNILTKTGTDYYWMGTICENALENNWENKWKITVLKTKYNRIIVGVAPSDFDINTSSFINCGWYLNCKSLELYSGPPHNYGQSKKKRKRIKS